MTSRSVQFFFENVNLSSSYDGLSPYQIWFNLEQGKQSYRGGQNEGAFRFADEALILTLSHLGPQVENVLNRPGEIGLKAEAKMGYVVSC